jgi:hypothetical protein
MWTYVARREREDQGKGHGMKWREFAPLGDLDQMPFGKYKGETMQDVPASYLHWLWTNGKNADKQCPVADYIRRNLNALKREYSDGIWT